MPIPIESLNYDPIYLPSSTFKNPRQKIWGLFIVGEIVGKAKKWRLVASSNNYEEVKELFNDWLQEPITETANRTNIPAGINNVMMVELLPVNSNSRL